MIMMIISVPTTSETLVRVINHPATEGIPFILETPNDDEGWTHEIALLRNEYKQK